MASEFEPRHHTNAFPSVLRLALLAPGGAAFGLFAYAMDQVYSSIPLTESNPIVPTIITTLLLAGASTLAAFKAGRGTREQRAEMKRLQEQLDFQDKWGIQAGGPDPRDSIGGDQWRHGM